MPWYDFRCHDCTLVFEERRSFARASAPTVCPSCGSENTYKLLAQITFVSGEGRDEGPASSAGGCACGGACACGY